MPRLTLYDIRYNTRIPDSLVLCRDDPALVEYINEAQELVLSHGHWWGTMAKWSICAINGCVTLPAQLAAIERAAVCHRPIPVHDMWFEFLDHGWGTQSQGSACESNCGIGDGANYVGNFPSFDDVRGLNKKLNPICDLDSDVGKTVILLGYDENLNWIRTEQDGSIKDGERVSFLQSTGNITTKKFSSITDIKPPDDMDGQWWLYEYNTDDTTKRMIGRYDYWETRPSYPRYRVGGVWSGPVSQDDNSCRKTLIEVLAKLEFIPVKHDEDYLIIGNRTALKEACLSVKAAEPPADIKQSEEHLQRALRALDKELETHLGSGRRIGGNFGGTGQFAAGAIEAFM